VTVKGAAVVALHESVALPEFVMLLGVMVPQVSPAGTVSVKATVPVKPPIAVTVIVDVIVAPGFPDGEVANMVKSVTMNVAVVECESVPLVPVMVRL